MGVIQSPTLQVQSFQTSSANSHFHHYALPPSLWFFYLSWFSRSVMSTLCDPVDCSTPGFYALHHLLELAQTHVHWVNDAIQPPHPLSSPLCRYSFLKNYIQLPIPQNSRKNKRYWLLAHAAPQFQFFSLWKNVTLKLLYVLIYMTLKWVKIVLPFKTFNHLRWLASK